MVAVTVFSLYGNVTEQVLLACLAFKLFTFLLQLQIYCRTHAVSLCPQQDTLQLPQSVKDSQISTGQ